MSAHTVRITRSILLLGALVAALAAWPSIAAPGRGPLVARPSASQEDPDGARVIVKYKASAGLMKALSADGAFAGPQFASTLAARHGLVLANGHAIDRRIQVVHGDRSLSSAALAARLAADPDVEYAVPDFRRHALAVPNDPLLAASPTNSPAVGQWYLRTPDSTAVSAIDALAAWTITTGSASIVVADVDTGVRFDHPDLTNKLLPGRNFVSANGDGNGWSADASDPGDWTTAGQCGAGQDATPSSWHGTQTAGLIGAQTDNGIGMASVGYQVKVLPVRVLGPCGGYDSDIIAAMLWAGGVAANPVANPTPARVINLSLGSSGNCTAAYTDAVARLATAEVVVVAAAGNEEGLAVGTPANCAGVIAVAAVRQVGTKVGFSSIGPQVAVSAPGGNCVDLTGPCLYPILTTTNSGTTTPAPNDNRYTDGTDYSVGTSFSTPLVSGAVGLMLSANPGLTPGQVKSMLQSTARPFPIVSSGATTSVPQCLVPGADSAPQDECMCTTLTCGAGLLDAGAAVALASGVGKPPVAVIAASASSVTVGAPLTLDAGSSSRSVVSYAWSITGGQAIASLSSPSASATAVTTTAAGPFTVALQVTDANGKSGSSSMSITAVSPPTAKISATPTRATAGSQVSLDGSASIAAAGLAITGYQWSIVSGQSLAYLSSSTNAATATLNTLGNASGSVTVQLTVTDNLGQQSSTTTIVTVTAAAAGPTANIQVSSTAVSAGSSISFDGSGSTASAGRTIAGYQWSITSGGNIAAFSGATNGATATVATSGAGSFTVQLTVIDSAGAGDAKSTTITVNPGSSSSGGGALSGGWLLALVAATAALGWPRRRV